MRTVFCLIVLAASLAFSSDIFAQGRNSITGFVFAEARTPVPRVYVELQTDTYSTISRVQTNNSGMFTFNGLASGRYVVTVMTNGTDYQEQSQAVSLVPLSVIQGRGSVAEQVDFYLRVKSRKSPLASPAVVFAQDVPADAKALYDAGVADLAAAKEAEAYDKLKRSLEIFPTYYYALDKLGNEYVAKGHYQAAIVLLTQAVKVNPRSFSSAFGLGLAEFRVNRLDNAVEQFRNALNMDKESANANLWLGISLHAKGQAQDALNQLKKANTLSNGTVAEVHWQLARVYKDLNKFAESANELELFLKYKPDATNAEEVKKIIQHLRSKKAE